MSKPITVNIVKAIREKLNITSLSDVYHIPESSMEDVPKDKNTKYIYLYVASPLEKLEEHTKMFKDVTIEFILDRWVEAILSLFKFYSCVPDKWYLFRDKKTGFVVLLAMVPEESKITTVEQYKKLMEKQQFWEDFILAEQKGELDKFLERREGGDI